MLSRQVGTNGWFTHASTGTMCLVGWEEKTEETSYPKWTSLFESDASYCMFPPHQLIDDLGQG